MSNPSAVERGQEALAIEGHQDRVRDPLQVSEVLQEERGADRGERRENRSDRSEAEAEDSPPLP